MQARPNKNVTPAYPVPGVMRCLTVQQRAAAIEKDQDAEAQEALAAPQCRGRPEKPAALPPELQPATFEAMFAQLLEWKEMYYDCLVPRQAFDAGQLGDWVHRLRRLYKQERVPEALAARLDGIGFAWRVDNITAKWYHNLHVLRRYKALHGTAEIPEDYQDPAEPDFVEGARWLARQKDHYLRQKLLQRRVRLIKEALGISLERPYAPRRRNLHPVIRREDARFKHELQGRAQQQAQRLQQAQRGSCESSAAFEHGEVDLQEQGQQGRTQEQWRLQ
ncbi:hypothetical protein N2152v2_000844 [Parachlorella kessleri]